MGYGSMSSWTKGFAGLPSLSLEEGLCHDEHALIARKKCLYLGRGFSLNKSCDSYYYSLLVKKDKTI